jgi:hypothetical protein
MGHAYPDTTMHYVRLSMQDINDAYHRAQQIISQQKPR